MRCAALLRGINVGGRNKVAMADLRALLSGLGHTDVATHLQSGNAVFSTRRRDTDALAREVSEQLRAGLGLDLRVLVRTHDELARVVAANPMLAQAEAEPARFLVVFLSAAPPADRLAALDTAAYAPDRLAVGERALYLWCPNSIRDSKLAANVNDKRLGVTATARNWTTVQALLRLTGGGS